ncbi:MAG: sugar-binding protein [Verrucomicrobium sp.]|nr:sugar-binding protein [Verrucomicrobium sp.]
MKARLVSLCVASSLAASLAHATLLDRFGQPREGVWPGKVEDEAALRADVAADAAYYDSLRPRARDAFGGLPGSGKELGLEATGFFHVENKDGRSFLVDPAGNAFFHLGVCGVGPGDTYTVTEGRAGDFAWLPPQDGPFQTAYRGGGPAGVFSFYLANTIRKYGAPYDADAFSTRMIERLRQWGFNSIGAFSPLPPAVQKAGMPYVSHLPLDPSMGLPTLPGMVGTWDPFEAGCEEKIDRAFARVVDKRAADPLLIGWFLANEPLYEDIPRVVPGLKADHACKRELVAELRKKYADVAAFNAAWNAAFSSFDELGDAKLLPATRAAVDDLRAFNAAFYERYFATVAAVYRRHDSRHLLIGNRLQPGTINDEALCRAAGRHLDVMSFNYYTDALDADFLRRIHEWTGGLPMILSEFYWASKGDSGLSGGRAAASQKERGLAYRNYVEQSAALGFVVGIEWFQLIDEAADGRWYEGKGGERANCGLLSVADRPWKETLDEITQTHARIYDVWLGKEKPFVLDLPRFTSVLAAQRTTSIPRATGPIALDGSGAHWPGVPPERIESGRLVVGADASGLSATYKACWDDANLYVLVHVTDPTPLQNRHTARWFWMGDAVEVFVGTEEPDHGGPLRFTDRHYVVGAKQPGAPVILESATGKSDGPAQGAVLPAADGYSVEIAIPWKDLGATPRTGLEILFDVGIDDSADGNDRRAQLMWSGTDKNPGDRTHWGHATLLP